MSERENEFDLCVIGGGINGAGIARDAAGRGLKVCLLEARDLACATSSSSSKLIHGGIRYLEFYEFGLVRSALQERETLLGIAPHLIRPMEFILPHDKHQRPYILIQIGLWLYDHLAKRIKLPASKSFSFSDEMRYGAPLNEKYAKGFSYADCWVDDSRLVVLNAMDAAAKGAVIHTQTECTAILPKENKFTVRFRHKHETFESQITAGMVVNAAGPWVSDVIEKIADDNAAPSAPHIRLVKGSHIIVPKLYEGAHAYILQQKDKRIVFAIPYEDKYTCIGTTEESFSGDPYEPHISDEEMQYLCAAVNASFKTSITKSDVLWTYSGVRPLFEEEGKDNRSVSREYVLHEHKNFTAPMISVFGGKLTTYRVLAEEVVDRLMQKSGRNGAPWTAEGSLPGGHFTQKMFEEFYESKAAEYPFIPDNILRRLAHNYGTRMDYFLRDAKALKDLGADYGGGLFEAEVAYLIRHEYARAAEDVLWRRTKCGLHMSEAELEAFPALFDTLYKKVG